MSEKPIEVVDGQRIIIRPHLGSSGSVYKAPKYFDLFGEEVWKVSCLRTTIERLIIPFSCWIISATLIIWMLVT